METHLYGKVPVRMVCEPRTMSPKRYFKMVKSAGTSKDATLCLPSALADEDLSVSGFSFACIRLRENKT